MGPREGRPLKDVAMRETLAVSCVCSTSAFSMFSSVIASKVEESRESQIIPDSPLGLSTGVAELGIGVSTDSGDPGACRSHRSAGFSEVLLVGVGVAGQQRSGIAWIVVTACLMACAQCQEAGSRRCCCRPLCTRRPGSHCLAGGLQPVLDEYAHVLNESLGVSEHEDWERWRSVAKEFEDALSTRTSVNKVDETKLTTSGLDLESRRMRSHFRGALWSRRQRGRQLGSTRGSGAVVVQLAVLAVRARVDLGGPGGPTHGRRGSPGLL